MPLRPPPSVSKKSSKIIRVDEGRALQQYAISKLSYRRIVAATVVLYKMHPPSCPADLKALLPQVRPPGRFTQRVPQSHPWKSLKSEIKCLDRSFIHCALTTWNSLPPAVVVGMTQNGVQVFNRRMNKSVICDCNSKLMDILTSNILLRYDHSHD